MKYYELRHSIGNDIGCFPQSEKMSSGYDYHSSNSVWNVCYNMEQVDLDSVEIRKCAKLTDIISVGFGIPHFYGLIISSRTINLFKSFNIPENKLFQAIISYKNSLYNDYFLFNFKNSAINYVDLNKSKFKLLSSIDFSTKPFFPKLSEIRLFLEDKNYAGNMFPYLLRPESIVLNQNISYDLFSLGSLGPPIVSKNLAEAIIDQGLTGFRFDQINWIKHE